MKVDTRSKDTITPTTSTYLSCNNNNNNNNTSPEIEHLLGIYKHKGTKNEATLDNLDCSKHANYFGVDNFDAIATKRIQEEEEESRGKAETTQENNQIVRKDEQRAIISTASMLLHEGMQDAGKVIG